MGRVLSREILFTFRVLTLWKRAEGDIASIATRKMDENPARSETPSTCGRISPGNREVPCLPWRTPRPHREV